MKIIISPAKKMNIDRDTFSIRGIPVFMDQVSEIMQWIQSLSWEQANPLALNAAIEAARAGDAQTSSTIDKGDSA